MLTESDYLIVNYQIKGKTIFSSEVESEVCRKIGDKEEEFNYLASKVIFNFNGQRIEK